MSVVSMNDCLMCPFCGGKLSENEGKYLCVDCGNQFERRRTEDNFAKLQNLLDSIKAEQVANIRRRLWTECHREYLSTEAIRAEAGKILDILPDDNLALFYQAAVSDRFEDLNAYLDSFDVEKNADDLPMIIDFSVKVMGALNVSSVKALAERGLSGQTKSDAYSKIEEQAEKIAEGIYDTNIPRTVFLAYSSRDMKKVNEICAFLEDQGFSCFVALRNLRHGKGAKENYQQELENAIANCKCIVFVSSENSRSLACDAMRIELPFIRKKYPKMPRIEYLIEDYGGQTKLAAKDFLKVFFADLEYCTNFSDLASRVWQYDIAKDGEEEKEDAVKTMREELEKIRREREEEKAERAKREEREEARRKAEQEEAARRKAEEDKRYAEEAFGGQHNIAREAFGSIIGSAAETVQDVKDRVSDKLQDVGKKAGQFAGDLAGNFTTRFEQKKTEFEEAEAARKARQNFAVPVDRDAEKREKMCNRVIWDFRLGIIIICVAAFVINAFTDSMESSGVIALVVLTVFSFGFFWIKYIFDTFRMMKAFEKSVLLGLLNFITGYLFGIIFAKKHRDD